MQRKKSRPFTVADVRYVYKHYPHMTAQEISDEIEISRYQVNRIVSELRKHGVIIKKRRKSPTEHYIKKLLKGEKKEA